MIVDDEPLVRRQLRRSLELRGYTVAEAVNGRRALATVDEVRPDVIILDMTMPDIDGAEVLQRLRAAGSRVPVDRRRRRYLDALGRARGLAHGEFQGFLAKPYAGASDLAASDRARARDAVVPPFDRTGEGNQERRRWGT